MRTAVALGLYTRLKEWVVGRIISHNEHVTIYVWESTDFLLLEQKKINLMTSQVSKSDMEDVNYFAQYRLYEYLFFAHIEISRSISHL